MTTRHVDDGSRSSLSLPTPRYDAQLMGSSPDDGPRLRDRRIEQLPLHEFRPTSQLRLRMTTRARSSVPAIDAHAHLGRWLHNGAWAVADVHRFVDLMDQANIERVVNLDGLWGEELDANLDRYDRAHPGRFLTCCHVDWSSLARPDAERALVAELRRSAERGAKGLKVWKSLGLSVRDRDDLLVGPDDERIAGVWETAAELALPVFMHTGDPVAFFEPVDARNERLEELIEHPEWSYAGGDHPGFDELMAAFVTVVDRHPRTTFVGVHVAGFAEDLSWVSRILDEHQNLTIDIAGRIAELGRQPRATRALIERHPTRVLFGTDGTPPTTELYATYFRFLESADEHFPYSMSDPPPTGRWNISGLALTPELLGKVYRRNADDLVSPATTHRRSAG